MTAMIIRPTMKFIYLGYIAVIVIVAASVIAMLHVAWPDWIPSQLQPWIPWLPAVLFLWPLKRHLRNRGIRMTILDDSLRYDSGLINKTTRSILVSRVQDVTVHQHLGQRIFGIGDLSVETAGEASRETIHNIDQPQQVANYISEHCQKGPSANVVPS